MTANFVSPLFSVKAAIVEDKEATAHLLAGLEMDGYDVSVVTNIHKGSGSAQAHPILVDREHWESKDPRVVPLLTDLSKVKSNSDRGDRIKYNEFEFQEEGKYYERETLEGRTFVQIRSADDVDHHLAPMIDIVKSSLFPLVVCGYDTEGKSATMQISVRIEGHFGPGKPYEKNAVVHLKSDSGRHCLAEGVPVKLLEFFTMEKFVFVGKAVKDDVVAVATLLKVPADTLQRLKYIELDQVFSVAYNYSRSEAKLLNWVKHMPKKSGLGPLGLPGLKNIHCFAKPTHVLGKLDKHRDDRSNWDEKRGPVKAAELRYAALDAIVGVDSLIAICQGILGIRWQNFIRVVGKDVNDYFLPHLLSIAEAMVGEREISSLDAGEKLDLESLLRNIPEIEKRIDAHQKRVLGWGWKKEIFLAELKFRRKGSPFVIKDRLTGEVLLAKFKEETVMKANTAANNAIDNGAATENAANNAIDNGAATEDVVGKKVVEKYSVESNAAESGAASVHAVNVLVAESGAASVHAVNGLAAESGAATVSAANVLAAESGAAAEDAATPTTSLATPTLGTGLTRVRNGRGYVETGGEKEEIIAEIGTESQKGEVSYQSGMFSGNHTENIDMGVEEVNDDPLRKEMALFEACLPKNVTFSSIESTSSTSLLSNSSGYSSSSNPPPVPPPSLPPLPPPLPPLPPLPPSPPPSLPRASSSIRAPPSTKRVAKELRPNAPASSGFVAVGSRPKIRSDKVRKIAASLRRPGSDIFATLVGLRSENVKEMTENCINTLKEFSSNSNDGKRRALIAREMKKLFRGAGLHNFVMRIINEEVFGKGRLRAAAALNYFLLSPFIIVDNILAPKRDGDSMRTMVRAFRGSPAMEVIEFIANNYGNKEAILSKLRAQNCFVGYEVVDFDEKWTLVRIKDFIRHTCHLLERPIPEAARPIFVAVDVESHVKAFLRGEIEEYDFFHVCSSLTNGDASLFRIAVEVVAPHAPHLANFLATQSGLPSVEIPEGVSEVVPACATPFNTALHDLPLDGSLVVRNSGSLQEFQINLERSRYFSADLHCTTDVNQENEVSLITFCTRSKLFHVAPWVFPDLIPRIIEILRTTPRPFFLFRWSNMRKDFLRQFGWEPEKENVVEVMDVAKEIGIAPSLDAITEKTVGGSFCRRAANFAVVGLPSEVAQRHCAIKATLFYEFVVKFRRLRERRRQQQQPPPSANSGHGHRHRRERDQELFPDERRRHDDRDRDRSHRRR